MAPRALLPNWLHWLRLIVQWAFRILCLTRGLVPGPSNHPRPPGRDRGPLEAPWVGPPVALPDGQIRATRRQRHPLLVKIWDENVNGEPSVLGGSTDPRQKATMFLTKARKNPLKHKTEAYHPWPVSPPSGDGPPFKLQFGNVPARFMAYWERQGHCLKWRETVTTSGVPKCKTTVIKCITWISILA